MVEENNLNQNITALRKSLGDSRQDSQYIATIPGLGYRFVADVKRVDDAVLPQRRPDAKEEAAKEEHEPRKSFAPLWENVVRKTRGARVFRYAF